MGQHYPAGVFELEENILVTNTHEHTDSQGITSVFIPVSMSLQFAASLSLFIAAEPKMQTKHCKFWFVIELIYQHCPVKRLEIGLKKKKQDAYLK